MTPTQLLADGGSVNVIPGRATARLDIRVVPGQDEQLREELISLIGDEVQLRFGPWTSAIESPLDAPLVGVLQDAINAEDPGALVVPYLLPASTDNKSLARLGINGYGFVPLRVHEDLDVFGQFHSADESVPVDALRFCARTTWRILRDA